MPRSCPALGRTPERERNPPGRRELSLSEMSKKRRQLEKVAGRVLRIPAVDARDAAVVKEMAEGLRHGRRLYETGGQQILSKDVQKRVAQKAARVSEIVLERAPARTRAAL